MSAGYCTKPGGCECAPEPGACATWFRSAERGGSAAVAESQTKWRRDWNPRVPFPPDELAAAYDAAERGVPVKVAPHMLEVVNGADEIVRIEADGRIFWRGREVETDDHFRAAMLDMCVVLMPLVQPTTTAQMRAAAHAFTVQADRLECAARPDADR